MSEPERVEWWITTAWFEDGGEKVAGPFTTMHHAITARRHLERTRNSAFWIDSCEVAG